MKDGVSKQYLFVSSKKKMKGGVRKAFENCSNFRTLGKINHYQEEFVTLDFSSEHLMIDSFLFLRRGRGRERETYLGPEQVVLMKEKPFQSSPTNIGKLWQSKKN